MRLGELYDAEVCTEAGKRIGKVNEVAIEAGRVVELGVGAANFLERLFSHRRGRHVKWEKVVKIEGGTIIVGD